MAYNNPAFPAFLMTFGSFVLLVLITCSVPLVSNFYFLRTSEAGGVRFGIWGWCLDEDGTCSKPLQLGYSWDPQIIAKLTIPLVFYPISAIFSLLSWISLIPLLANRKVGMGGLFSVLALLSFLTSLVAFAFMIALWSIARKRFEDAGFRASFGPLPWMSLASTLALMIVTINSGCGTLVRCQRPAPEVKPASRSRSHHHHHHHHRSHHRHATH